MSEETKYYGGTVTVEGRKLITNLIAGETIEFTRIVVGSGNLPDGVHPMDMKDLVNPVALGTSTVPVVENQNLLMTVEYRNDMNGGLAQGFWLSEFGIFAKTANVPECLLYYATLGDSPQPVNAFKDNRIDIRRYPVTIALEIDADVQVTYNPGAFITAGEAQGMIAGLMGSAFGELTKLDVTENFIIPNTGWKADLSATDRFKYYVDVPKEDVNEDDIPSMVIGKEYLMDACANGLCPLVETHDGIIRFWSSAIPTQEFVGTLTLYKKIVIESDSEIVIPSTPSGGGDYKLPIASEDTLGGVKVKNHTGLKIDEEGYLYVDYATDEEAKDAVEDAFGEIPVFPEGGGTPSTGPDIATDDEVNDAMNGIFG